MADYRCPIDDLVFETLTDHRKPGALASADGKFPAHPVNGHPDCPKCQERMKAAKTSDQPVRSQARRPIAGQSASASSGGKTIR